ncbi:MAG: RNA-binding protein [Eubacteriales bacterium]
MKEEVQVGQLVKSAAGRDKGKFYLIYDVLDKAFVRVIDGDKKKLTNPKKKNIKHLKFFPVQADAVAGKLRKGEPIIIEEISEAIHALGLSHKD